MKAFRLSLICTGAVAAGIVVLCASTVINSMYVANSRDFVDKYGEYLLKVRHPLCAYDAFEMLESDGNLRTYRIHFKGHFTKSPYHLDVTLKYNSAGLLSGFEFGNDTCPVNPEDTRVFLGRMWNRRGIMMVKDLMDLRKALQQPIEPLAKANDITPKKAKAKFKYKNDTPADAQQGWKFAGSCPTAITMFDQNTQFRVRGRLSGEQDALDHQNIYPNKINKKGTRCNTKFRYTKKDTADAKGTRSVHHEPSYGFLKAALKNGELKFAYVIPKANQGNKMMGMEHYATVRDYMGTNKVYEGTANFEVKLDVTGTTATSVPDGNGGMKTVFKAIAESHDFAAEFKFKAKSKKARGKIVQ